MSADAYDMKMKIKATTHIARTISSHLAAGLVPTAMMIDAFRKARALEESAIVRRTQELYLQTLRTPAPCPICKRVPETRHVNGEYITDCGTGDLARWVESATSEDEFPMLATSTAADSIADWNGYANAYTEAQREVTE